MKTEAIIAIEYLLEKLDDGLECHCDIFREIYGMKPGTAERRLREWREIHDNQILHFRAPGYTAHRSAHKWVFTKSFIKFLKQQICAAAKLERQNAEV